MTAGRGMVHSERSPLSERTGGRTCTGCSTWSRCPTGARRSPGVEARTELPLIEDTGVSARHHGRAVGRAAPTTCHAATIYAEIVLGAVGAIRSTGPTKGGPTSAR